jgi:hypothetical protein
MTPNFAVRNSDARVREMKTKLSVEGERYPTQNHGDRDAGFAERRESPGGAGEGAGSARGGEGRRRKTAAQLTC